MSGVSHQRRTDPNNLRLRHRVQVVPRSSVWILRLRHRLPQLGECFCHRCRFTCGMGEWSLRLRWSVRRWRMYNSGLSRVPSPSPFRRRTPRCQISRVAPFKCHINRVRRRRSQCRLQIFSGYVARVFMFSTFGVNVGFSPPSVSHPNVDGHSSIRRLGAVPHLTSC